MRIQPGQHPYRRIKTMMHLASCMACLLWIGTCIAAPDDTTRAKAVQATAEHSAACTGIGDFYWEIGDAHGVRGSGSIGHRYDAHKSLHIASASKWMFGSYVAQRVPEHIEPGSDILRALEMQSGYVSLKFASCIFAATVGDCQTKRENSMKTDSAIGKFWYNGGHDQKLAVDLGLGNLNRKQFAEELKKELGSDLELEAGSPQPAGGLMTTPDSYARFLRKIMSGDLRMHDFLGRYPVCTLPGTCAQAIESPVPLAWHYSLNHWIEDDPQGDGAYSSPGAFGFYPWISGDRQWYGILARQSAQQKAYQSSVLCGQKLRKAWITGASQM
jgi:hypothetical protein